MCKKKNLSEKKFSGTFQKKLSEKNFREKLSGKKLSGKNFRKKLSGKNFLGKNFLGKNFSKKISGKTFQKNVLNKKTFWLIFPIFISRKNF